MQFSWSFGGQSVGMLPGVSTMGGGRKASMLLIDPLGAMHSGNYTCTVKNRAGVANYTSELRINGKLNLMLCRCSPIQYFRKWFLSPLTNPCIREMRLKSHVS